MKKFILTSVCIFCACLLFGQTLSKGNVLGMHVTQFELKPGVTIEQLEDFVINKYVPAFNHAFEEMTAIPIKGLRGEHANSLGLIYYMKSDDVRNKYFASEGVLTELGQANFAKIQKVNDELSNLATQTSDPYTDWIVK